MLVKEYRIPMPFTTDEYKIGQLFMIAKHSSEQSEAGEGVEVVHNVPHNDKIHGDGRYTEKRIHLSNRMPYWLQSIIPRVFYVVEKSWNYYPYTETEYTCSFLPKLNIFIKTRYEDNGGSTENCLDLTTEELETRLVDRIDIAYDEVPQKHYKETEDPKFFKSTKTGRGPLPDGWILSHEPIMCSYKYVKISFEVWGVQTRVEDYAQKAIRDILLLGHRQAFAWIDDWYGMTEEDVRDFEKKMQEETNKKVLSAPPEEAATEEFEEAQEAAEAGDADQDKVKDKDKDKDAVPVTAPENSQAEMDAGVSVVSGIRSWFSWS